MFDTEDIRAWEAAQHEKSVRRFFKTKKEYFDPRRDALIRHRRRASWKWLKESKCARKMVQERFRMNCKTLMIREDYHNPVPHEYKTYGWETW